MNEQYSFSGKGTEDFFDPNVPDARGVYLKIEEGDSSIPDGVYTTYITIPETKERYQGLCYYEHKNKSTKIYIFKFSRKILHTFVSVDLQTCIRTPKKNEEVLCTPCYLEEDFIMMQKIFLRKNILNQWNDLDTEVWKKMNYVSQKKIESDKDFLASKNILAYAPILTEINYIAGLFSEFPSKNWYFPKIKNGIMRFYMSSLSDLSEGYYGVLEPSSDKEYLGDFGIIDYAFIPALATDAQGHRLGRGKGFYDSVLGGISAKKICVLPNFSFVEKVPTLPHDIAIDETIVV